MNKINRLQFISLLQGSVIDLLARNRLHAERLASATVDSVAELTSRNDLGQLLAVYDDIIEREFRPEMYDAMTEKVKAISNVGGMHGLRELSKLVGTSVFSQLTLSDRLALDYISRPRADGKVLSDRLWDDREKERIYKEVFESVRAGETRFQLAKRIEEVVAEGTPAYNIKRVAETELNYAYSHAKVDIVAEEAELFGNAEAYVRIRLSPAHPKPDICDLMVGTYKADQAPLPPYHPNCLCIAETIVRPSSREVKTTTIEENLKKGKDELKTVKTVETRSGVINVLK